jgi:RNA-dependent RNA polymerase
VNAQAETDHAKIDVFMVALADFNIRVTRQSTLQLIRGPLILMLRSGTFLNPCSLSDQSSLPEFNFDLLYQLEVCISRGWLNEYTLCRDFLLRLAEIYEKDRHRTKQMLIHVDTHEQRIYDPMSIFTDLRFIKPVKAAKSPSGCAEIRHATVTATGVIFHTPAVEMTNRIIRKYDSNRDRFLRVRFEDDVYRGQSRLYPATNGRMKLIFDRVRRTMKYGIEVGGRIYEFLAWGNFQLREHGAWSFATSSKDGVSADVIRRAMGIFDHEHVVAKRAARMGQCFSTTKPVPYINRRSWRKDPIPDIYHDIYNFTDGVGRISPLAASLIKINLKIPGKKIPSAFQFLWAAVREFSPLTKD